MKREHLTDSLLPEGYIKLQYLGSSRTQYIDTNIVDNNTHDYEIQWQLTGYNRSWELLFGVAKTNIDANWIWVGYGSNNRNLRFSRGSTGSGFYPTNPAISYSDFTNIHTLRTNGKNSSGYYIFDIDGNTYSNSNTGYGNYDTGSNTLLIFNGRYGSKLNYPSTIRVFYFNVLTNGEVTHSFIPALRKSDNKPGLYDLCGSICPLTGTPFYVNAGTGEFLYQYH